MKYDTERLHKVYEEMFGSQTALYMKQFDAEWD